MVFEDVNFDIEPGECVAFVGGPGSGKTALMHILMGETKPTQGSILVDGIPLEKLSPRLLQFYRKNLGVMLQKEQLLSDRSIAENIALPLKAHGAGKKETATRVMELLHTIQLEEKIAMPRNSRADSASAWPWPGRSRRAPKSCCSMNRSANHAMSKVGKLCLGC